MDNDSTAPANKTPRPVPKPVVKPIPKRAVNPIPKPVAKPVAKQASPPDSKPNTEIKKIESAIDATVNSEGNLALKPATKPVAELVPKQPDASSERAQNVPTPPVPTDSAAISMLDSLYEGIIITDPAGAAKTANTRITTLLGYDVPDLEGKNVKDLFHSLNDSLLATIWSGVKEGKHTVIEMPCLKKDGGSIDTETSVSSIAWKKELSICFSIRDNMRHKTQESMLIAVNNAIANTASGIVVTNVDGVVEFANPAFMKMTGNKDDLKVIGRNIREFVDETVAFEGILKQLNESSSQSLACRLKGAEGIVPAYINGSPNVDHDGKLSGMVFTCDDMTVLHESQEKSLETERIQSRLDTIATLSHTINSPLQKLMSMAELDDRADYRQEINHIAEIVQKLCQDTPLAKSMHPDGVSRYDLQPEPEPVVSAEFKILIVEDEELIRNLFKRILKNSFPKAMIDLASSSSEAIEQLTANSYSVVILDVMVPDQNGEVVFHKMSEICESKQWKLPHVVFCTGFIPGKEIRDIVNDGTTHKLLRKPVTAAVLTETVSAFLPE